MKPVSDQGARKAMMKVLKAVGAALSLGLCTHSAAAQEWSPFKITGLYRSVTAASNEGLPRLSTDALVTAISTSDAQAIDAAANDLALRLARAHLLGVASQSERSGWHIVDTDAQLPLEEMLAIDGFDEDVAEELRARAKDALLTQALATEERIEGVAPAEDLLSMEGMDDALAASLARRGIVTMEDLAEQSIDELLEIEGVDATRAAALIMKAREPWFA